jgi:Mycothiol maleylpyruvate isomerase N-terminal domain
LTTPRLVGQRVVTRPRRLWQRDGGRSSIGGVDSRDVDDAVREMVRVLSPHDSSDWRVPAGVLDWSCLQTAVHVAHDLIAYATQVVAQRAGPYLPFDLIVRPPADPHDVLELVTACGGLLASALTTADPDARGWHWGPTDLGGFAVLGVNEILVHTHDITQGLGVPWVPPISLAAEVLARLFPDAPVGDPRQVLLWATGRVDLDGQQRVTSWVAKAALS